MAKLDSLTTIQREWTLDTLLDAHEVLDMKEKAEAEMMAKIKAGDKR